MREVYHSPRDSMAQPLDFVAAARLVAVLEALVRRLGMPNRPHRSGRSTPSGVGFTVAAMNGFRAGSCPRVDSV